MTDHFKACERCGQTVITRSETPMCATCARVDREPQGETVRLFAPAPAQMPGQVEMYGGLPVNPLDWPKHLL